MIFWLSVIGLLTIIFTAIYAYRRVGGLFGSGKNRPMRGSIGRTGGGTHQDKGASGRPRRPRRGGF